MQPGEIMAEQFITMNMYLCVCGPLESHKLHFGTYNNISCMHFWQPTHNKFAEAVLDPVLTLKYCQLSFHSLLFFRYNIQEDLYYLMAPQDIIIFFNLLYLGPVTAKIDILLRILKGKMRKVCSNYNC